MSNELSLEKYLLLIRAQARLILSLFTATVVMAGIVTFLTPKTYTATTVINFDFNSSNPIDSRGGSLDEDTYLFTQVDIIKSQNVAQRVEDGLSQYEWNRLVAALEAKNTIVDKLRGRISNSLTALLAGGKSGEQPADVQPVESGGEVNFQQNALDVRSGSSWLARAISYDLTVQPRFNSRVVEISFRSTDRQMAALLANRFAEAYMATNLEMTIDPARKTTAWFDEQLKSLRKKLEDAQAVLTDFQQQQGIVSSDESLDTETSRLQELSSQLVTAQQATRNAVTAQQKLQAVLDSGASLMTFEPVFSNPVVLNVRTEIRKLEGELVVLSSTLGSSHPRIKRVSSELQAARARLENEIKSITNGILNTAELARTRERDLAITLEAQKQLLLDLKQEHDRIAVLKRDVESAQAAYHAALTQVNTTSMQSMMNQTNVSVVDPANVPSRPSSPKVMQNLILGGLAGLVLGIGLVVFLELFQRRVYSKEDITLELGIPLLGHLKKV